MKMALVPVDGSSPVVLDKAILFLGRGVECDVVITTSRKVSRKHCCVALIDDRVVVRDLASMNGVRVNDTPVDREHALAQNDILWVGDVGYQLVPQSHMLSRSNAFKRQAAEAANPPPIRPVQVIPLVRPEVPPPENSMRSPPDQTFIRRGPVEDQPNPDDEIRLKDLDSEA